MPDTYGQNDDASVLFGTKSTAPTPAQSAGVTASMPSTSSPSNEGDADVLFGKRTTESMPQNQESKPVSFSPSSDADTLFGNPSINEPDKQHVVTSNETAPDPDAPWYKKTWDWANSPLVDEQHIEHWLGREGHAGGFEKGVYDLLAGLTSPLQIALTVGTFGSGALMESGGAAALRAAGMGAEEIGAVAKGSQVIAKALQTGKSADEAYTLMPSLGINPSTVINGLETMAKSGLKPESLIATGVVRRAGGAMLRSAGLSIGQADKMANWVQFAVDAGFTAQNAYGAAIASPRVLDAIKEGDYESAKRLAVDALGSGAFAALGGRAAFKHAGELMEDSAASMGLKVKPSEENLKLIREFEPYQRDINIASEEAKNWELDVRKRYKDMSKDDMQLARMRRESGSEANMAKWYNYVAEAAGRDERIDIPGGEPEEQLEGLKQQHDFVKGHRFRSAGTPDQYERLFDFQDKQLSSLLSKSDQFAIDNGLDKDEAKIGLEKAKGLLEGAQREKDQGRVREATAIQDNALTFLHNFLKDAEKGMGQQPEFSETASTVQPEAFLKRVTQDGDLKGTNQKTISELRTKFQSGLTGDIPPVELTLDEEGRVIGADGRHRAAAALQAKVERIPVNIRRRMPVTKASKAIENRYKELVDQKLLKDKSPEYIDKLLSSLDPNKLTDRHMAFARESGEYFDKTLERAVEHEALSEGAENYVTRVWKKPDNDTVRKFRAISQGSGFSVNTSMARHRIYGATIEGLLRGEELADHDMVSLAAHNHNEFGRIVASRQMLGRLREKGTRASDGRPMVALSGTGHTVEGEEGENPAVVINPKNMGSVRIADKVIQGLKRNIAGSGESPDANMSRYDRVVRDIKAGTVYHGTTEESAKSIMDKGFAPLRTGEVVNSTLKKLGKTWKDLTTDQQDAVSSLAASYKDQLNTFSVSSGGEIATRWAGKGGEIASEIEKIVTGKYPEKSSGAVVKSSLTQAGRDTDSYKGLLGQLERMEERLRKTEQERGYPYSKDIAAEELWKSYSDMRLQPEHVKPEGVLRGQDIESLKEGPIAKSRPSVTELDKLLKEGKIVSYGTDKRTGKALYAWTTHDYKNVDNPAFRGWKVPSQDTSGSPVIVNGELRAHPDAHEYLNRRLGTQESIIKKVPGLKTVLAAGREAKGLLLFVSPFHVIQEGLRAVMTGISPFSMEKFNAADPMHILAAEKGVWEGKDYKGVSAFEDGMMGHSKLLGKAPGLRQLQHGLQTFLFDRYIPALKLRAFRSLYDRYQKAYPEWTRDKAAEVAASDTNERFGGIAYKRMGRSAGTMDAARLLALAPDWLESEMRFMGRMFGDEGKLARRDVAKMALYMWGAARVLNYVSNGQAHNEAPFGVVHKDDQGREKVYSLRTMPTDMLHAANDPAGFLKGRVSPLMRVAAQTYTGRDEFGRKIPEHGVFVNLLRNVSPIPAQAAIKYATGENPEISVSDSAVKAAGLTVFPYRTEAQKKAAQLASEKSEAGPVDPAKLRRHQTMIEIENQVRQGKVPLPEVYHMVEQGVIHPDEAKQILKNAKETQGMDNEMARLYAHATRLPLSDLIGVWNEATNEEKAALSQLLIRKKQAYLKKVNKDMSASERASDQTYLWIRKNFPQDPPW